MGQMDSLRAMCLQEITACKACAPNPARGCLQVIVLRVKASCKSSTYHADGSIHWQSVVCKAQTALLLWWQQNGSNFKSRSMHRAHSCNCQINSPDSEEYQAVDECKTYEMALLEILVEMWPNSLVVCRMQAAHAHTRKRVICAAQDVSQAWTPWSAWACE